MRAAKVQTSLRIRAVSPVPSLLAHTSSESRGTFRQKARSLAPLNGWACAVEICHEGMLKDTNSLDGAHVLSVFRLQTNPNAANINIIADLYAEVIGVLSQSRYVVWDLYSFASAFKKDAQKFVLQQVFQLVYVYITIYFLENK